MRADKRCRRSKSFDESGVFVEEGLGVGCEESGRPRLDTGIDGLRGSRAVDGRDFVVYSRVMSGQRV